MDGTIMGTAGNADGSGAIPVMGVAVMVPTEPPITTPTACRLTQRNLASGPRPGCRAAGFLGGTAIIAGTSLEVLFTAR